MLSAVRHFVFGAPFPSSWAQAERLAIPLAFVIVSSNALSSVAYAPEEVFIALGASGVQGRLYPLLLAIAIVLLVFIVVLSYEQVVRAYPGGGGAYVVARQNLGNSLGLVAAAGLLVDYVLTVSVSVTAGVASLGSALPFVYEHRVEFSVLFVVAITVINLRGVRESALILALPVYLFLAAFLVMIGAGVLDFVGPGGTAGASPAPAPSAVGGGVGAFSVLRAFAAGCVLLTGLEAISNTVGIFRPPAARNARVTLALLGGLLVALFIGVTLLALHFGVRQTVGEGETLVSKVARSGLGAGSLYYLVLASTMLILLVAANTSFAAFPRLASILARDGYLARPIANLGDRLVYTNGILLLAALSVALIVVFRGTTHLLIPLYAVGVFVGFALTQAGMVVHWWKSRERGWLGALLANGLGAAVTGTVLVVIGVTRFTGGAYIVAIVMALLLGLFTTIRGHYRAVAEALSLEQRPVFPRIARSVVVVPIGGVHRAVLPAIEYARAIGTTVRVVHVAAEEEAARVVEARWNRLGIGIPLTILPSPYRAVVQPLVDYIRDVVRQHPEEYVTVVIPEFVPKRWWQHLLHNQTATLLKIALLYERRVIVVDVPYHLEH
ncbi:MAG: APC family permease [Chloroflexi bacterium]|nr:APC family permease [Chloroflexota bacterium]